MGLAQNSITDSLTESLGNTTRIIKEYHQNQHYKDYYELDQEPDMRLNWSHVHCVFIMTTPTEEYDCSQLAHTYDTKDWTSIHFQPEEDNEIVDCDYHKSQLTC